MALSHKTRCLCPLGDPNITLLTKTPKKTLSKKLGGSLLYRSRISALDSKGRGGPS